ncbi:MAG: alanine racemase [bacterium]|nr:alanine racemase [bacterium]
MNGGDTTAAVIRMQQLLLDGSPGLHEGELLGLVADVFTRRRASLLEAAQRFGTPLYVVHADLLQQQANRFTAAFSRPGLTSRVHYAFKANPSAVVVNTLRQAGIAADVSSGLELELALRSGFERVVFSGPAKTDIDLENAVLAADRVTVHLDSFAELERLQVIAGRLSRSIRAGVRLSLAAHGAWTKFGLPPMALPEFVQRASACPQVDLQGVQFHLSWQRDGDGYARTLADLGPLLRFNAPAGGWRFVDVGGGFYPEDDEAVYPWRTPQGRLQVLLGLAVDGPAVDWNGRYLVHTVQPIETIAAAVIEAFGQHVDAGDRGVELWLEPGRYLANPSVTILLQVADVKSPEVAITDGGTNLLGWERLEEEHVPLLNLTRPASSQRHGRVYGSLCTPHDVWGYTCYAEDLQVGDILALPAQGSYVQTLQQAFIKPIAATVVEHADGRLQRVVEEESFTGRYPELFSGPDPQLVGTEAATLPA